MSEWEFVFKVEGGRSFDIPAFNLDEALDLLLIQEQVYTSEIISVVRQATIGARYERLKAAIKEAFDLPPFEGIYIEIAGPEVRISLLAEDDSAYLWDVLVVRRILLYDEFPDLDFDIHPWYHQGRADVYDYLGEKL